jgi:Ca-activated chloride channel homolog
MVAFMTIRHFLRFGVLGVVLALSVRGTAQSMLDEPCLSYRPNRTADTPASGSLFRANVNLVLMTVTVLDRSERSVSGLRAGSFEVLDDKNRQNIKYFSNQDDPIALAVVLDASASMAPRFEEARRALLELIDTSNPQDDFNVILVGDKPRVALDASDSLDDFRQAVASFQPDGQTALWDGMMLGVRQLHQSSLPRKAMIVISDGGDNHSRITERELKSILRESGVEVYAIALSDPYASRREEKIGPLQLQEVTSLTGGRELSAFGAAGISRAIAQIGRELRDQYVIGYYPSHQGRDGKWHKVKVSLNASTAHDHLRIYARQGYYKPAE